MAKRLRINVDGGARGNPGPAAAAAVASDESGEIVSERGEFLGIATNNVAEYKALILGVELAKELGVTEADLVGDSELVVKQINGQYKVKDANLQVLWREARAALDTLDDWTLTHVKRAQNKDADRLVNQTLDARS